MIGRLSHITRVFVIGLLFTGFTAHLAIPFFGDAQKTAFTQWLDHKIVTTGDHSESELRDRIKKLPKEASNFWMLVQDASKLIAEYEEEFRISPFSSTKESDRVSTWLIGQWSTFKHQQSNANAVLPELVKPIQKWISQNNFYPLSFLSERYKQPVQSFSAYIVELSDLTDLRLPPPISGISINAP